VKRSSAALLAATLTVPMVLAGCSGDTESDASRSSSTTSRAVSTAAPSTTSASPSPAETATPALPKRKTDPNIPAAARVHNPGGGLAFTRYFIERWNVAWSRPRAGILAPLCHPSSETCAVYEKTSARLVKQGRRLDGDPFTIKSIKILDENNARRLEVLAVLVQEPRNEIDRAGKIYRTEKGKPLPARFVLLDDGRGWALSYIDFLG
jgi:hypothetical protein